MNWSIRICFTCVLIQIILTGIWFLKIKLRPILSKIVCMFFTYKVWLFSFAYNLSRSLYILEDNFSVVIKRLQKQSILHLMLMSRGYLPNSPYTRQFGVVTLTPKILFKNCKCTFSILSFLPTPQTSLPYNRIGATSESKMFSCKSIGSCRFLIL